MKKALPIILPFLRVKRPPVKRSKSQVKILSLINIHNRPRGA